MRNRKNQKTGREKKMQKRINCRKCWNKSNTTKTEQNTEQEHTIKIDTDANNQDGAGKINRKRTKARKLHARKESLK